MTNPSAIDYHREVLLRLLAGLFAMAGLNVGGVVARLPKPVQLAIMRTLRPAESALRRLIVMMALDMAMPEYTPRSAPTGAIPRGDKREGRIPPFRLFDPRKSFPELSQGGRRPKPGPGPRIFLFDGSDMRPEPTPEKPARDPEDAASLCARMLAMQKALEDMPKQARRMLRALAKRAKAPPGPRRYGPLRPGLPPGYCERRGLEIDEILFTCDLMARQAMAAPPDTS